MTDYSRSIYIDSSVKLLADPKAIWDLLIPNPSIVFSAIYHSYRETIADEFAVVAELKLDYLETLDEQQLAYQHHRSATLSEKPIWGGFIARQHMSPFCISAMELWFANVLRYSRRDQLSLPLALSEIPEHMKNICEFDNYASELHQWPVSSNPKPSGYRLGENDSWLSRKLRAYLRKTSSESRRR